MLAVLKRAFGYFLNGFTLIRRRDNQIAVDDRTRLNSHYRIACNLVIFFNGHVLEILIFNRARADFTAIYRPFVGKNQNEATLFIYVRVVYADAVFSIRAVFTADSFDKFFQASRIAQIFCKRIGGLNAVISSPFAVRFVVPFVAGGKA